MQPASNELKLYKAPTQAVKLLTVSILFVAIGLWGIHEGRMPGWLAWLGVGFFGLGLPIGLFHLFDRRPQIIINEVGIFDRTAHTEFINWEIIQDAYPIAIHKQEFICLLVDEHFRPSRTKSAFYRGLASLNQMMGAQELNISLGQVRVDTERLTSFILLMRTATRPERQKLLVQGLT